MKSFYYAFVIAVLMSSTSHAQTPHRDMTIRLIEEVAFGQANVYTAKSPLIEMFLAPAKSANPGVSPETWEKVKSDLAAALAKAMSENGGPMGGVLTGAVDTLSDEELDRISKLLNDPIYRKFQTALSRPEVQQRIMQKSAANSMKMIAVVNTVLANSGLKVPH